MTDDRYSRQILFPGIGAKGQQRLRNARVTVVGCGALGTVSCEMLTRAGVGRLSVIDRDFVEVGNLQRQTLFTEEDAAAGTPKAIAARRRLSAVNSEVEIDARVADLVAENAHRLLTGTDLIVDAADNFEARFLVNDWAFQQKVPWIYGACVSSYGIAFAFQPGRTGCLQCLFPEPPRAGSLDTCDTAGVIAPVVHAVAAFQVTQALKLLVAGQASPQLLQCDVWQDFWRTRPIRRSADPDCRCCGRREFRFLTGGEGDGTVRLCGREAVQVTPAAGSSVDFGEIRTRLERLARVETNEFLMRIQVDGYEISLFPDGRSIIRGTDDPAQARSLYARYVGG